MLDTDVHHQSSAQQPNVQFERTPNVRGARWVSALL